MSNDSLVQVLLPLALETTYTYAVPDAMSLAPGDYVRVPLGPRQIIGVVWSSGGDVPDRQRLRDVVEKLPAPPMPDLHRNFIDWLARYYVEAPGQVLRIALRVPAALGHAPEKIAYLATGLEPDRLTPQRRKVLHEAASGPARTASDLADAAGVGRAVVIGLAKAGALEEVPLPALAAFASPDPGARPRKLSRQQAAAAARLRKAVAARKFSVMLLDGVTGSGKTEVYFEAMAAALAQNRQTLLLLPEIALTSGFLRRLEERFGTEPACWHSGIRPRQRERVWRAVASGEAKLVLGARSSLFLPWANLGLIVVDEEHEAAFKQEEGVNYHARDMSIVYASLGGFPAVLCSATPSLETLWNVEQGRYAHVTLPNRHGGAALPDIGLIDMRGQTLPAGRWISPPLAEAVTHAIETGGQALLFLNRRGYAPLTLCRTCGFRLPCPNCSSWLVEHRFRQRLACHHCGHEAPVPAACPSCSSSASLVPIGPGVERLAEEAASIFPGARTTILSSDLARGTMLADTLKDIATGAYDLVIGTQLVAKGHHFPGLTLAGVIDADLALETMDPRAGERTWQMLAQVAGRTGRGGTPGRALVQTYLPDHPLMRALDAGDREAFLTHEFSIRRQAGLPPFARLAGIIITGKQTSQTRRFADHVAACRPAAADITVYGPAPAPLAVVRGMSRFRLLVSCARDVDIQCYLRKWLGAIRTTGSLRISIDVDPYSFL